MATSQLSQRLGKILWLSGLLATHDRNSIEQQTRSSVSTIGDS